MSGGGGREDGLVVLACGSYGSKGGVANVLEPAFEYFPYVGEPPVERGVIKDFVRLCGHWSQVAATGFNDFKITDKAHSVLLLCPMAWSKLDYEQITKFFFEHLGVPALSIMPTPIACLLGCNVNSGLVVDIGYETTEITPVLETNIVQALAVTLPVGVKDVFAMFRELDAEGKHANLDQTHLLAALEAVPSVSDKLADEVDVTLAAESHRLGPERYQCVEVLFDPTVRGIPSTTFRETMWRLTKSLDVASRKAILENVVLSGAGASIKGIQRRVESEVNNVLPQMASYGADGSVPQVRCRDIPFYLEHFHRQPEKSWWVGGSILAKLIFGDASRSSVLRDDYDVYGPSIIHTKSYGA
ncbi:hypothetical protein RI367_004258 [Sorochytrium milnesiophthora]